MDDLCKVCGGRHSTGACTEKPKKELHERVVDSYYLHAVRDRRNLTMCMETPDVPTALKKIFKPLGLFWEIDQLRIKDIFGDPKNLPEELSAQVNEAQQLHSATRERLDAIREKQQRQEEITKEDLDSVYGAVTTLYDALNNIFQGH